MATIDLSLLSLKELDQLEEQISDEKNKRKFALELSKIIRDVADKGWAISYQHEISMYLPDNIVLDEISLPVIFISPESNEDQMSPYCYDYDQLPNFIDANDLPILQADQSDDIISGWEKFCDKYKARGLQNFFIWHHKIDIPLLKRKSIIYAIDPNSSPYKRVIFIKRKDGYAWYSENNLLNKSDKLIRVNDIVNNGPDQLRNTYIIRNTLSRGNEKMYYSFTELIDFDDIWQYILIK